MSPVVGCSLRLRMARCRLKRVLGSGRLQDAAVEGGLLEGANERVEVAEGKRTSQSLTILHYQHGDVGNKPTHRKCLPMPECQACLRVQASSSRSEQKYATNQLCP